VWGGDKQDPLATVGHYFSEEMPEVPYSGFFASLHFVLEHLVPWLAAEWVELACVKA
jgi:hypothetical protein